MTIVAQEWSGPLRSYLIRVRWDCNDQAKLRWIREMDHEANWRTFIELDHEKEAIDLVLERRSGDQGYTAGKRIRIENFENFFTLFHNSDARSQ